MCCIVLVHYACCVKTACRECCPQPSSSADPVLKQPVPKTTHIMCHKQHTGVPVMCIGVLYCPRCVQITHTNVVSTHAPANNTRWGHSCGLFQHGCFCSGVSTDVPRHLKHFKVGGAGCQFPLLQSSPLTGLSHSLPLACLTVLTTNKRGTIYSCTKEVLYTVSTDVPRHLKHFKVGGAGCQFPLLQSSPLTGLSHSLPLACLPLSHRSPSYLPLLSSLHSPRFPPSSVHDLSPLSPLFPLSWKGDDNMTRHKPYGTIREPVTNWFCFLTFLC